LYDLRIQLQEELGRGTGNLGRQDLPLFHHGESLRDSNDLVKLRGWLNYISGARNRGTRRDSETFRRERAWFQRWLGR
jgi:hypothetical protein